MKVSVVALALALVSADPAGALEFTGRFVQGGLVIGQVQPRSAVTVDGRSARVSDRGEFLIGLARDATGTVAVVATAPEGAAERRDIAIQPRKWDIQRVDGLPQKLVMPPEAELARIREEAALVRAARDRDSVLTGFRGGFDWPVTGPLSGIFGSQRILNGEPRAFHNGVDVAAPSGSIVRAPSDGVVTLAHPGMYFNGKTVMIDHGHGLSSVYIHMSDIAVVDGQRVARGDPIGKVGATGRATGPHLHWGVNLFDVPLDPALLVPPMPAGPEPSLPGIGPAVVQP